MTSDSISQTSSSKPRFISLRWRLTFPLALIVLLIAMIGAYILASQLSGGFSASEENILLHSSEAVANRSVEVYQQQRSEAQRIAYTVGIAEAMRARQAASLHDSLKTFAQAADLDSIVLTDQAGIEIAGVLRVRNSDPVDFAVSTETNMADTAPVRLLIESSEVINPSGLLQTTQGLLVYTAVRVQIENQDIGIVMVGRLFADILQNLKTSAVTNLTLFNADGQALNTTFDLETTILEDLKADPAIMRQTLESNQPTRASIDIAGQTYRVIYMPLHYGDDVLGVVATTMLDHVPFATSLGRQITSLFASIMAGAAVIVVFVGVHRVSGRMEHVRATAQALTSGQRDSRTGLVAVDEVGAIGHALDEYATVTQQREDQFRSMLRRERRERTYLFSVIEAMPDGVVVQDDSGKVLLINERARDLLGTQAEFQRELMQIETQISEVLGPALAPGIYALGDPQQIEHQGHMLSIQAAAVLSAKGNRVGTVMLIRDITSEVQQEHAREELLTQLSEDIQQPLASLAQSGAVETQRMISQFAREISRHAAALQKMIVDMRELTRYSPQHASLKQRPILAETLLLAVSNDWRQISQAANLQLRVMIETKGAFVLGDESRLRWAIGNIVDNAIKYTLSGGALSLEIKQEHNGLLHMRVRDNGVGIADGDLKHIFMPFYRGTPLAPDGQVIRVPGMGQGLTLARQVIQAHGGAIRVKSKPTVGTAVYFALPITSGEGYELPLLDVDAMEGETVLIPEDVELDAPLDSF